MPALFDPWAMEIGTAGLTDAGEQELSTD